MQSLMNAELCVEPEGSNRARDFFQSSRERQKDLEHFFASLAAFDPKRRRLKNGKTHLQPLDDT